MGGTTNCPAQSHPVPSPKPHCLFLEGYRVGMVVGHGHHAAYMSHAGMEKKKAGVHGIESSSEVTPPEKCSISKKQETEISLLHSKKARRGQKGKRDRPNIGNACRLLHRPMQAVQFQNEFPPPISSCSELPCMPAIKLLSRTKGAVLQAEPMLCRITANTEREGHCHYHTN